MERTGNLDLQTRVALTAGATAGLATLLVTAALIGAPGPLELLALAGSVALLTMLTVFCVARRLLVRELQALHQLAAAIDDVDLDGCPIYRSLPERGPPEIERILAAWNGFALRFDIMVHNVRSSTSTLNETTRQIATVGSHAARRAQQQAEGLRRLFADIETLSTTDALTTAAGDDPTSGPSAEPHVTAIHELVERLDASLRQVHESEQGIRLTLQSIDRCAVRSNQLALNATIAAARCGDQGQGLAAVADELRGLARNTIAAARENEAAIERTTQAIGQGQQLTGALRERLQYLASMLSAWQATASAARDRQQHQQQAGRAAKTVGHKLMTEARTVAQRTEELVAAANEATTAAAAVEACVWPPPELDDRDVVAIGEGAAPDAGIPG